MAGPAPVLSSNFAPTDRAAVNMGDCGGCRDLAEQDVLEAFEKLDQLPGRGLSSHDRFPSVHAAESFIRPILPLIAAAAPGAPAHRYRSVLTSGDLSDPLCYLLVVPRSVMMEEWGPAGPRHDRLPSVVDDRRRCCHRGSLRRSRIADRGGILFEDRRNVGAERAPIRPASMLGQQRMRRGLGPVRAATAGGVRRCGRR